MSLFSFFRRRKSKPVESSVVDKDWTDLIKVFSLTLTKPYVNSWSRSVLTMLEGISGLVRNAVKSDLQVLLIISDTEYVITRESYCSFRLRSFKRKSAIDDYKLEITLTDPTSPDTNRVLIVTAANFDGLYLMYDEGLLDLSGILPDCRTYRFYPELKQVIDVATSERPVVQTPGNDNIVPFTPRGKE